MLKKGLGS